MDESLAACSLNGNVEPSRLLLDVVAHPGRMADLTLREWDVLLRIADRTGMSFRLAVQADELIGESKLPPPIVPHVRAAVNLAAAYRRSMDWEIDRLQSAFQDEVGPPIVLLKGAAYTLSGLTISQGRLSCDLDVMVPKAALPDAERALVKHGWMIDEDNPFDEEYFRRWLHELPPMRHRERGTLIDLHHTILPRTDRLRVDPQLLLDAAVPIENTPFSVLAPVDMVLHCATHLFRKGDFTHGLRDLCDLDGLLREFGGTEGFWDQLLERAPLLDLTIPCSHAMHYVVKYLDTPIPHAVAETTESWRPRLPPRRMMDSLVDRALFPRDPLGRESTRKLAIWWLQFWPPPRLRAVCTWSFWSKRVALLKQSVEGDKEQTVTLGQRPGQPRQEP